MIATNNIPGNITATISDHIPHFFIAPDIFFHPPSTKLNIFEKDRSKFDQENFILDDLSVDWKNSVDWENSTRSENGNVDQSFVNFLTRFNSILDMYAPLKMISK